MTSADEDVAPRPVDPGRAARAAALTLAVSLAVLTGALGYVDGTGLFAPENWLDAGLVPTYATSPALATVVYLPLLVAGSGLLCHRFTLRLVPGTPSRWAFWGAWSGTVLAAVLAKIAYTILLLAVVGPRALHATATIGAVLAECGLSGAKYTCLGLIAAGPAALAYRLRAGRKPAVPGGPPGREAVATRVVPGRRRRRRQRHDQHLRVAGG